MSIWLYVNIRMAIAVAAPSKLLQVFAQTLPITIVGLFAGLAVAFMLAILSDAFPAITRTLMPMALIMQTMPLVALRSLLVLLLGRGAAVTLCITISSYLLSLLRDYCPRFELVPRCAGAAPGLWGDEGKGIAAREADAGRNLFYDAPLGLPAA